MHSVNIQFHMLFEELVSFVADESARYQLEIELEQFFPQAFRIVPLGADLIGEIKQFGQVDRFWLLYTSTKSKMAEKFMLNVGRQRGNRLAQSQLGAGARKAMAFEVLKHVARDLKMRTSAGLWVIGETGIGGYVKNFRISEGATDASRSGEIELVSPVFTQSFHVDRPEGVKS